MYFFSPPSPASEKKSHSPLHTLKYSKHLIQIQQNRTHFEVFTVTNLIFYFLSPAQADIGCWIANAIIQYLYIYILIFPATLMHYPRGRVVVAPNLDRNFTHQFLRLLVQVLYSTVAILVIPCWYYIGSNPPVTSHMLRDIGKWRTPKTLLKKILILILESSIAILSPVILTL